MSRTRGNKIWLLYYIILLLLSFWTVPRVVNPESNNFNQQYLVYIYNNVAAGIVYIYTQ